jgi:hypothetical protein
MITINTSPLHTLPSHVSFNLPDTAQEDRHITGYQNQGVLLSEPRRLYTICTMTQHYTHGTATVGIDSHGLSKKQNHAMSQTQSKAKVQCLNTTMFAVNLSDVVLFVRQLDQASTPAYLCELRFFVDDASPIRREDRIWRAFFCSFVISCKWRGRKGSR